MARDIVMSSSLPTQIVQDDAEKLSAVQVENYKFSCALCDFKGEKMG